MLQGRLIKRLLLLKNDIGNKRNASRTGQGGLDLSRDDFAWVIEQVKCIANLTCKGRVVVALEGMYMYKLRY